MTRDRVGFGRAVTLGFRRVLAAFWDRVEAEDEAETRLTSALREMTEDLVDLVADEWERRTVGKGVSFVKIGSVVKVVPLAGEGPYNGIVEANISNGVLASYVDSGGSVKSASFTFASSVTFGVAPDGALVGPPTTVPASFACFPTF